MRALSLLFAALLGIALAMLAPALAGPGASDPGVTGPVMEAVSAELPELDAAAELDDNLIADLGIDELNGSILDGLRTSDDA